MSKNEARDTLFAAIKSTTDAVVAETRANPIMRASSIRELAIAYRLVSGGAVASTVSVDNK